MRLSFDDRPRLGAMSATGVCECGQPATANGSECPACFVRRLRSVNSAFTPSRSAGAGQIDPEKSRRWEGRLEDYRKIRHEGSQPLTTRRRDIEATKQASDEAGAPVRADRHARQAVA